MNQREIINYLISASDETMVQVFATVFDKRFPAPAESDFTFNRFCLAVAWRDQIENTDRWGSARLEAIAYIDKDKYPTGGLNDGLCQEEVCGDCGVPIRSTVKQAICPVCSAPVKLT